MAGNPKLEMHLNIAKKSINTWGAENPLSNQQQ